MTRTSAVAFTVAGALAAFALALFVTRRDRAQRDATDRPPATPSPGATGAEGVDAGFLYGRVTALGGTYEGRLRFGGDQEAFWTDTFNGRKARNAWAALVSPELLPTESRPISVFGVEVFPRERPLDLSRQFMARFGDIARIEAHGRDVRVTLKSGGVLDLDRFEASDFDDGVRVWDAARGVVDLDSSSVRSIELLPAVPAGVAPGRLHGTVRTREGAFDGFVQWDRDRCLGSDELVGRTDAGGQLRLRFETIRSVARRSPEGLFVTLVDGREIALAGGGGDGAGHRGIYVDDGRYGRVLVSSRVFERVDFSPGGSGPAYGDFPAGRPLAGSVTTRDSRRLAGRLVYDLDESEVTETLDAPARGVDYTLPFGLIASIVPAATDGDDEPGGTLTLRSGEELRLERAGDLGARNAGMLVFVEGRKEPEYVPWAEVARIDLEPPAAFYPRGAAH